MAYLHSIFQDIADIISNNSDRESVKLKIETHQVDWEKIVPVASKHLVIPLIYFKLKEKELLHLIPEDLKSYLEEITRQNRERNKTILKEVRDISLLLNSEKIDHVFLKGAAMLVSGIYTNTGERMIGDIDILVKSDQLLEAQKLLLQNGYSQAEKSLTDKYFEQKHLPRLIPKNKLAAIELHRRVLHTPVDKLLQPETILKNKIICNGIHVSDSYTMNLHSILNFEINDLGYYYNYLGLRNTNDVLLLLKNLTKSQTDTSLENKYIRSFYVKIACYFKVDQLASIKSKQSFRRTVFLLKQKNKFLNKVYFTIFNLLNIMALIFNRLFVFITNSSYRQDSFRKRKQILKFIKSRIQLF